MRFRNLKKKVTMATDPPTIIAPPTNQIPLPTVDPIVELTKVTVRVQMTLPWANGKGRNSRWGHS